MAIPVIGLASSGILLGESLTAGVVAGLGLVLFGVGANLLSDARSRIRLQMPS
jgi:hypothetical protein